MVRHRLHPERTTHASNPQRRLAKLPRSLLGVRSDKRIAKVDVSILTGVRGNFPLKHLDLLKKQIQIPHQVGRDSNPLQFCITLVIGDLVQTPLNVDTVPATHVMSESNDEPMPKLSQVPHVLNLLAVAELLVVVCIAAERWRLAASPIEHCAFTALVDHLRTNRFARHRTQANS
jgi:hypothetical protein